MSKNLEITFFSSSDFAIQILESILAVESQNIFEVASRQLQSLSTSLDTSTVVFPEAVSLAKSLNENKTLLSDYTVVQPLVITQPDRMLRNKIVKNPISSFVSEHSLRLYQPQRLKKSLSEFQDFVSMSRTYATPTISIGLVASFGQILPIAVINNFEYGIINWHPSLLPLYRGPTPMQTSLAQGDIITGLSWITMDEGMDSGDIITQFQTPQLDHDTTTTMSVKFGRMGADTWAIIVASQILRRRNGVGEVQKQELQHATYTTMLNKEQRVIVPVTLQARAVINHFRAYRGFPGTVIDLEYFEGPARVDEIVFNAVLESTLRNEEIIKYEDTQLIITQSRRWVLKTQFDLVEILVITLLNSGKRVVLKGLEPKLI